jgi:hypothetical protein
MSPSRTQPAERPSRRAALAGLAALPVVLPVAATAGPDPIFTVIERHRELSTHCDEAVSISAKLMDGPEFDAADEISAERRDALVEYAAVVIRSEPTTMAGIAALIRYVASLGEWQVPTDDDWHQVFLGTLANALDRRR